MAVVKCSCYDKVPKYRNPQVFHQNLFGNIPYYSIVLSDKCESVQSTHGSVNCRKVSGVHWSSQKHGDKKEELKVITSVLVE